MPGETTASGPAVRGTAAAESLTLERGAGPPREVAARGIDKAAVTESRSISRSERIFNLVIQALNSTRSGVYAARPALSHMRNADPPLSHDEVMSILYRLQDVRRLADFLIISGEPDILKFLIANKVPWSFILSHWELSLPDASLFLAGVFLGGVESAIEAIRFVAFLILSPYIDNIANGADRLSVVDKASAQLLITDRDKFWDGIGAFLSHPLVSAAEGAEQWFNQTVAAFVTLDFYQAGRRFGQLIFFLLTLPSAIRSAFRLGRLLSRGARAALQLAGDLRALGRLSPADVLRRLPRPQVELFALRVRRWLESRRGPEPAVVTEQGALALGTPEEGLLFDVESRPLGKVSLRELDDFLREPAQSPRETLEGILEPAQTGEARAGVRSTKAGSPFVPASEYVATAGRYLENSEFLKARPILEQQGFIVVRNSLFGETSLTKGWARRLFGERTGAVEPGPDWVAIHPERKLLLFCDACPGPQSWVRLPLSRYASLKNLFEGFRAYQIEGRDLLIYHLDKSRLYGRIAIEAGARNATFLKRFVGYTVQVQDFWWEGTPAGNSGPIDIGVVE